MSFIELTKSLIENIGGIIVAVTGLIALFAGGVAGKKAYDKKAECKKSEEDNKKGLLSIINKEKIQTIIDDMTIAYGLTFVNILKIHDSGKRISPLSPLYCTMIYEAMLYKKEKVGDKKDPKLPHWTRPRVLDKYFVKIIGYVGTYGEFHLQDITKEPSKKGVRTMYNYLSGREVFFLDIGWVNNGTSYIVIAMQREDNNRLLKPKTKGLIKDEIYGHTNNIKALIESTL